MKSLKRALIILVLAAIISACGAEPVPTINAADVQSTAMAAAFTMVAQTQAAIPTATLPPPSETPTSTPLPTDTPVPLPTLEATFVAVQPTSTTSGDFCDTRILSAPAGLPTTIRVVNKTNTPVAISLYLNKTVFDSCGYRTGNLAKRGDTIYSDLVEGCYNVWALSNDPKNPFTAGGYGCINNSDKWTFEISESSVILVAP